MLEHEEFEEVESDIGLFSADNEQGEVIPIDTQEDHTPLHDQGEDNPIIQEPTILEQAYDEMEAKIDNELEEILNMSNTIRNGSGENDDDNSTDSTSLSNVIIPKHQERSY